jgi:general secretion pathway protein J
MRRRTRESGFTLVELLVTLSLLALLAMLLHSGIRDGARAWRTVDGRSHQLEDLLLTQGFLRERITSLGPPPAAPATAARTSWFDGADDRLAITVPWLQTLPVAGLYRMQFAAVPREAAGLTVRWHLDGSSPGMAATSRDAGERELLAGVRQLRFAYFGAVEEGGPKAWHAAWRSDARPPDLVRLDIEFDDPAREWPTLIVAVP